MSRHSEELEKSEITCYLRNLIDICQKKKNTETMRNIKKLAKKMNIKDLPTTEVRRKTVQRKKKQGIYRKFDRSLKIKSLMHLTKKFAFRHNKVVSRKK